MGKIAWGLHLRAARRGAWVALACWAAIAVAPSPGLASTAAGDSEPSLASRLGEFVGSVYGETESRIITPARQSAAALLADPRTNELRHHLSAGAHDLAELADTHIFQPISRGSSELIDRWDLRHWLDWVAAGARNLLEELRSSILDPVIAGLKRAMATPPAPAAAPPRLAGLDPQAAALTVPGLPQGDLSRYLNSDDPLEAFNRAMFWMNGGMQSTLFAPIGDLYYDHASPDVQLGVGNFFRNLREPATFVSSALEGQFGDAGTAAARFGINTTLGIVGFRDPATELGYTVRPRNLEETLCTYEVPSGPYVVMPILGPATLRDAAGRFATVIMYFEVMGPYVYFPYRVTDITVQYANLKQRIEAVNQLSPDPYRTQKALYLALRDLSCSEQAVTYREFFTK
jgi:phospholipid-binding lipoprotein MlaA